MCKPPFQFYDHLKRPLCVQSRVSYWNLGSGPCFRMDSHRRRGIFQHRSEHWHSSQNHPLQTHYTNTRNKSWKVIYQNMLSFPLRNAVHRSVARQVSNLLVSKLCPNPSLTWTEGGSQGLPLTPFAPFLII